uniref:Uncharacterized protein n=1 Tax=Sparus aurata TaxID=8175 RepID=A0A671XWE2_SPAAU
MYKSGGHSPETQTTVSKMITGINHLPNSNIHKLKLAKTRLCIIMLCLSGAAVIICTALKIRCFFELKCRGNTHRKTSH